MPRRRKPVTATEKSASHSTAAGIHRYRPARYASHKISVIAAATGAHLVSKKSMWVSSSGFHGDDEGRFQHMVRERRILIEDADSEARWQRGQAVAWRRP